MVDFMLCVLLQLKKKDGSMWKGHKNHLEGAPNANSGTIFATI